VTTATLPPADGPAALLDVRCVAALIGCSPRNVHRLADSGRMPRPLKIGRLIRWRRQDFDAWLAAGCPSERRGVR
jgi:excisionase family DNA binding protein